MPQLMTRPGRDWARFQPGPLAGMTLMHAHFTEHAFERHSHETYSVGVTVSGVQTFHCGGSLHASLRGDVILFNPDEAHDGQRGSQDGFGYAMLYVSRDLLDACRGHEAGLRLAAHFARPVVRDPAMGRALMKAVDAVAQPAESLRAQELVGDVLTRLLQRHGERRPDGTVRGAGAARMARARDYLCTHYAQDVTVDHLAQAVGLSRVHLTRAFTQHHGVPPHVYLNAVRVQRAREAMLAGLPLAEVAVACGFADQSHFSRRFKGSLGLTPAAWLQQMQPRQTGVAPRAGTAP
ncbi:MAG: AraC family transcriptional regulator [Ramlibacter sp.]|nr:AraC family transcriptional regulator [Ramlibacter sp.]